MAFPVSPRVIYDKNPLVEVICQLRFPPVLRIDSEVPAKFQEAIRSVYPMYSEKRGRTLPFEIPPEVAELMELNLNLAERQRRVHEFLSVDEIWKVGLTREFLSVSTKRYVTWEEFKDRLQAAFTPLNEEYKPTFFSRVGLRYRDLIQRSSLNLTNAKWSELLKPHIAGELSSPDVADFVEHALRQTTVRLDDFDGRVQLQHGLAPIGDIGELGYMIDSDFFTIKRTEVNNVFDTLTYFNKQSGRLFRWCIDDRLHQAMGPRDVK